MQNTYSVLNTVAATAGDISLSARILNVAITSTTGTPGFPSGLKYPNIDSIQVIPSLVETVMVKTVTYTAAANTTYSLTITQSINGVSYSFPIIYNSDAGGVDATIATALKTAINANSSIHGVVASGTVSPLTLTAQTGTPLFTATNVSNTTIAASMAGVSIASCTAATPTVCTCGAVHGLLTGNTITITSADDAKLASGTYRVGVLSTTTFHLWNSYGDAIAASATTTATVVKVAQVAQGQGATLAANGITGATSGTDYTQYVYGYNISGGVQMGTAVLNGGNTHILYVNEGVTATVDKGTNFSNFDQRMREVASNFVAANTTADPQSLAVAAISA